MDGTDGTATNDFVFIAIIARRRRLLLMCVEATMIIVAGRFLRMMMALRRAITNNFNLLMETVLYCYLFVNPYLAHQRLEKCMAYLFST